MKLINKRVTSERTSLHPASIMRLVKIDKFPKPVELGSARIAFVEEEVDAWIEARAAERRSRVK